MEVSLNSVVGLTAPRTMKLLGSILGHEVVVLIDSGASHNFLSSEVVAKLGLPLSPTSAYGIQMGSGQAIRSEGVCRDVVLQLQPLMITADFLPLQLGDRKSVV